MNSLIKRMALLLGLASQDLWHDRKVSFCIAASLVAVIAPLLLLFGLKHGVINQLQNELLSDPRNLEVKMLSSGEYSQDWIDQLKARPDIGFAIGQTRSLNTQADLRIDSRRFVEHAEIIPTAALDPLLATPLSALSSTQTILSHTAAQRLAVKVGDQIQLRALRKLNNKNERAETTLEVVEILPASRFTRPAAFVSLPLLIKLEQFRDGFHLPEFGIDTGIALTKRPISFSKVRMYASSIDSVAPLSDWLLEQHIESNSRLAEIESVKAINQVLSLIFAVIALTALIGCIASLIGAFLANIDRKRKDLAVLRLLGFNHTAVALYVMLQALLITLLAYLAGLAMYAIGSQLFNQLLTSHQTTNQFAAKITLSHGLIALALTIMIALFVSMVGALRAVRIQPAESLREL